MTITVKNKRAMQPGETGYYIGRPSPLGNPFSHLPSTQALYKVRDRDTAVDMYEIWLRKELQEARNGPLFEALNEVAELARSGDVTLVCWCHPQRCHGDVIKKIIEEALNQEGSQG